LSFGRGAASAPAWLERCFTFADRPNQLGAVGSILTRPERGRFGFKVRPYRAHTRRAPALPWHRLPRGHTPRGLNSAHLGVPPMPHFRSLRKLSRSPSSP